MKMGMALAGKKEMSFNEFLTAFEAAVEGVKQRGKSDRSEKTMLDAMIPALEAMKAAAAEGKDAETAWKEGTEAAEAGVEYTKTIIATKGKSQLCRREKHRPSGSGSDFLYLYDGDSGSGTLGEEVKRRRTDGRNRDCVPQ